MYCSAENDKGARDSKKKALHHAGRISQMSIRKVSRSLVVSLSAAFKYVSQCTLQSAPAKTRQGIAFIVTSKLEQLDGRKDETE